MRPYRIAIDAHRLICESLTSGYTYISTLLEQWQGVQDRIEFCLLLPFNPEGHPAASRILSSAGFRAVFPARRVNPAASLKAQVFWQQIVIPKLLLGLRADAYFSTFHLTPVLSAAKKVVTTIHDLCFLQDPLLSVGSLVHRAHVLSACLRANRLICVSQFTYDILRRWSPRAARKASVVPNGVVSHLLPLDEARSRLARIGADLSERQYLIWIGHPAPRKNPELLMDISALHVGQYPTHKLVLVAPRVSHGYLQSMAQSKNIRSLVLLDSVDPMTRDALYRCALALVFPSRCEGFGYPIVEAMAQACPPVALENSPARELAGDVTLLAKTASAAAFCEIIRRYVEQSAEERSAHAHNLVAQATKYSTSAMAQGTLKVLIG